MSGVEAFLAAHGYAGATRAPIPGDAGHRRYLRLVGGPRPAILMDGSEAASVGLASAEADLRAFLHVAGHIRGLGLSAPEVIAADPAAGLLLLEDLGDDTYAALLDAGADPAPLYRAAAEALAALHDAPPPPGLPRWDRAAMARAAGGTFLDWWWPAAFGAAPDDGTRSAFDRAVRDTVAPFAADGFVHRDYFPANLLRLDRRGVAATGILDFQDAALGHPAYDVVSLLEDARRDVAPALREATLLRYLEMRPGLDAKAFRAAMAALGAVRHLRVAALWVRLDRRDGKPRYLVHGSRCWGLLATALDHPAAGPLSAFLDERVPGYLRANPGGGGAGDGG